MVVKIFDHDRHSYDVAIDPNTIWGLNVFEYEGDEVLEFIMGDFSAQLVDVAAYTGGRSNHLTKNYSVGKKDLASWCEGREKHEA